MQAPSRLCKALETHTTRRVKSLTNLVKWLTRTAKDRFRLHSDREGATPAATLLGEGTAPHFLKTIRSIVKGFSRSAHDTHLCAQLVQGSEAADGGEHRGSEPEDHRVRSGLNNLGRIAHAQNRMEREPHVEDGAVGHDTDVVMGE